MPKRTIDNCGVAKKVGMHPFPAGGKEGNKCLGFSHWSDDEPIDECKKCKLNNAYGEE